MNKREWPRRLAVAAVTVLFTAPLFFIVGGRAEETGSCPPDGFEWFASGTNLVKQLLRDRHRPPR